MYTKTKDYSYLIGKAHHSLIALDVGRDVEADCTRSTGLKTRSVVTAECVCGNIFKVRASEYLRMETCGCKSAKRKKRKYVSKYVKKADREPVYEPCTVNGVALADYLRVYRETEKRERDKDTRKLFCHSVETNISILRSH